MKRLLILIAWVLFLCGCEGSLNEKEEKAEQLRRESQALLEGLSKSKQVRESENGESQETAHVSEEESNNTSADSQHENEKKPDDNASAASEWKNPYADYSEYLESPLHLSIKKRYEELFSDREKNPNFDTTSTAEQIEAFEKECDRVVGEEFGITPKEASEIYIKAVLAGMKNSKSQYDIFEYLKKYFAEEELPIDITDLEINRDLGKPEEVYIVLIHANFIQKQKSEDANRTMSVIAQNIAIHLQLMEHIQFSDLVFFFRDDYNQRDLKLTAEWDANFRGFFKTGIWY